MTTCLDCVPCEADGCTATAYCLSQPGAHPCPHARGLCENHNLDHCPDCRLEAEMNMYQTGAYSPDADPFYRPDAKTRDDAALGEWLSEGGYEPGSDSYHNGGAA